MLDVFWRILWGLVVWAAVWLLCQFVGGLLQTAEFKPFVFAGDFLVKFSIFIGFIFGAFAALSGRYPFRSAP